jgi:hypothetical protein
VNWNLYIWYVQGSLCQVPLRAYFFFEVQGLMFQSAGLLFILECKLFCSDVKHGLIVGGKKKRYVENKVLGKVLGCTFV